MIQRGKETIYAYTMHKYALPIVSYPLNQWPVGEVDGKVRSRASWYSSRDDARKGKTKVSKYLWSSTRDTTVPAERWARPVRVKWWQGWI